MVTTTRIVGPDGQPFNVSELREPQTAKLTSLHHEFQGHPSRGLTPSRLAQIMDAAEQGRERCSERSGRADARPG